MSKIFLIAHEFKHAEYYARMVLNIGRSKWNFVVDQYTLQDITQCEVILIEAPRYRPTSRQLELRCIINEVCLARRLEVKRVTLP